MKCKICGSNCRLKYKDLFDDRYGYPGKFNVYQCSNCGFGQTDPELEKEKMAELYTNYYPRQNVTVEQVKNSAKYKPGFLFKLKTWLAGTDNICHYSIEPNSKVLDIGCGNGSSLLDIKNQQAEAYGIEEDRNIESIAKELDLNIFFGSLEQTNFSDNYFDFITLNQVLEHIQDPVGFLQLALKKLKPNGKLIFSFPNVDSFYCKLSKRKWINWHIPYHLNFFSNKSIDILLDKLDLKIEKHRTITPNCWLELQLHSFFIKTSEGKKNSMWYPVDFTNRKQILVAIFFRILNYFFLPLDRIIDLLKKGDSDLYILSKK